MEDKMLTTYWDSSRSGAWAGRGFRYQDAVTALLAVELWNGNLIASRIVPEGFDDVSIESESSSTLIQIKSRGSHNKSFSSYELNKFVEAIFKRAEQLEIAGHKVDKKVILLERSPHSKNVQDLSEVSFEKISHFSTGKKGQYYIVTASNPKKTAIEIIQKKLSVLPSISEIVFHSICASIGYWASENAHKSYDDRYKITISDMEALVTKIIKNIDSSSLEEAIFQGVCVPVSFDQKLNDSQFYMGVNVEPGHIAAGLVVKRPAFVSKIYNLLIENQCVLISGPSGSGKSALQWMAVNQSMVYIRWFRITSLARLKDTASILSLIESLQPSTDAPVGLVLDDVGQFDVELFKTISIEARNKSGVIFLSSIRNEDVPVLGDISNVSIIPVSLDESLAATIWEKLRSEDKTSCGYWKEPFLNCKGLLLEYTHLLSQGERFGDLIKGQILRRKVEKRHDELNIIRVCSAAFKLKGEVVVSDLQKLIDIEPGELSLAIDRLIDEHLIRQLAPGIICGLHDLRSQALFIYAHDDIVFQKEESIKTALQCMTYDTLTIALGQAIQEFEADLVIDSLVIRLSEKDNPQEWIAALTGLGIATLQNISKKWIRILEHIELEPAHWPMATMMACSEGAQMPGNDDIDAFDKINVAVKEFRTIEVKDLRETLLGKATLLNGMQNVSDIEDLTTLFSSLGPITGVGSVAIDDVSISGQVEGSFEQLCNVLDNARAIDISLARDIVEKFGGTEHLLEQFYINTPWITMPKLEHGEHNEKFVLSDLYFITDEITPDIHSAVVKLCDQLCSIIPDADMVNARAIDINGNELRLGEYPPIASKSIPRKNITSKVVQRWNQVFISLAVQHSVANTETEYAHKMKDLLVKTNKVLNGFLEAWCKGVDNKYIQLHRNEIESIANESNRFSLNKASPVNIGKNPVEGGVNMNEPVSVLISGINGHLIPRLYKNEDNKIGLAAFTYDLVINADRLSDASYWKFIDEGATKSMNEIYHNLNFLRAILGECSEDNDFIASIHAKAKKATRGNVLRLCSVHAKYVADNRLQKEKNLISRKLIVKGWAVKLFEIPMQNDDGFLWPPNEFVITISLDNLVSYFENFDDILEIVDNYKCSSRKVYFVPVIKESSIWQFALSYLSKQPFPANDIDEVIKNKIYPKPFMDFSLQIFDKALQALVTLSGIISIKNNNNLHNQEVDVFNDAVSAYEDNFNILNERLEVMEGEKLSDAVSLLSELSDSVSQQQDFEIKTDFCTNLASSQFNALRGEIDDVISCIMAARIGLIEYELGI